MPIDYLRALNPHPPQQGEVGASPISFLRELPEGTFDPTQLAGHDLHRSLSRTIVREICTNKSIHPLTAYAVAMAWGGQRTNHFRTSILSPELPILLTTLRASTNDRGEDFAQVQKATASITGLNIAFYTKLLFFFRPSPDAYILDQWTAKSDNILYKSPRIRLGPRNADESCGPSDSTTADEYISFCERVDKLAESLWPGADIPGERAETAMFDVGNERGAWRNFVSSHFQDSDVETAIKRGAVCLTTQADFQSGRLVLHWEVLDRASPPRRKGKRKEKAQPQQTRWRQKGPVNLDDLEFVE